jgi:SAM-dependent methyltransferase
MTEASAVTVDQLRSAAAGIEPSELDREAWDRFFDLVLQGGGASDYPKRRSEHYHSVAQGRSLRDVQYVLDLPRHHANTIIPFLMGQCGLGGRHVLEFGAGTGGLSVAMVQAGAAAVTAVEPVRVNYEAGVWRTRAYGMEDRISFHHVEDTGRLPFAEATFDACVCAGVLQYVPEASDRARLLREMWRVVKPDGVLVVGHSGNGIIPGGPHSTTWWSNLAPARAARAGHKRGVPYWELARVLKPLGCRLVLPADRSQSELTRWRNRLGPGRLSRRGKIVHCSLSSVYSVLEGVVGGLCGLPVAVLMPYLNVAFVKRAAKA